MAYCRFIHIYDIVNAITRAAEVDYTGVINVGTGKAISFRRSLEVIKNSLGAEIEPRFIPKTSDYVENLEADTTLMKQLLGIEPRLPEEGINQFIGYLKSQ